MAMKKRAATYTRLRRGAHLKVLLLIRVEETVGLLLRVRETRWHAAALCWAALLVGLPLV